MSVLDFGGRCREITRQAELFADHLGGADVTSDVPTCPGWNVSQLARHVEGGLRWAAEIVATRATEAPPDTALRDLAEAAHDDPVTLAESLRSAAAHLTSTLRDAGPDARMWCPVPGGGGATFYARRFTHETAVHRADAAVALGLTFSLQPDVAADGVAEWLDLGSLPFHFEVHPWMRELLGAGRTIGLRSTDTDDQWLLDLTGTAITWRSSDEAAAADVRGPVAELLLALYRRVPIGALEVTGDVALVDFWLERVAFG